MGDHWYDGLSRNDIRILAENINGQEMDAVFQITPRGAISAPGSIYAPDVYWDAESGSMTIDGDPEWVAMNGYSGQYGYRGPVMHNSEYFGGAIAADAIKMASEREAEGTPLVWVMTTVSDLHSDEMEGWVLLYREMPS